MAKHEVEELAKILYTEGAYCGECEYEGWDSCSACRQTSRCYAVAVLNAGYRKADELRDRLTVAEAIISRAREAVREEFPRDQIALILSNPLPPNGTADKTKAKE